MLISIVLPAFIFFLLIGFFLVLHQLTKGDGRGGEGIEYFGSLVHDRRSESREELLEAEWEERKAKRDEERRRHLSVAEEYI